MNKKNYNLDLIEPNVRTQYGDYGGFIQIDGHGGTDLFKLCEDNGIDMDKHFLIGFGCGESTTTGIGNYKSIRCRALVIETEKYGNSFDEIQKNVENSEKKIKAKQIHFDVNYKDFGKYIKRFDLMVATKITKYISDIDIKIIE